MSRSMREVEMAAGTLGSRALSLHRRHRREFTDPDTLH